MPNDTVKKTVYFVRHGQSTQHDEHAHPEAPLSATGRRQAHRLAKRFARIRVDVIMTSTMPRARETAQIIAHKIGRKIAVDQVLEEVKIPSELWGKKLDDPVSLRIIRRLRKEFTRGGRYADEESFKDRRNRAAKIISLITRQKKSRLLVVAHNGIIRYILACLMFGSKLTYQTYRHLRLVGVMSNTGITACQILKDGRWRLVTWNDLAHLE